MASTPGPSSAVGSSSVAAGPSSSDENGKDDARPQLPWAFIDCPQDTLILLITHMLNMLIQHNDQVVLTPDALTRFHSRAAPGISVEEYLKRIVRYTNMETIPLLSLLAYIDVTCQNLPTFTLSSLTVHRFLIAGVCVGSKAQCDVFCTNSHYAKVGGIKTNELNALEREFLKVTQWTLACNAELLQRYYTSLIRSHGGYTQAAEPETSPFTSFDAQTNKESTEDVDTEMKSPGREELNVDMVSEPSRTTETLPLDPVSGSEPNLPSQTEDVPMEGEYSATPGRKHKPGDMEVDPTRADAVLDSPKSIASSSIPSSRSSLRTSKSSRGRPLSMNSFTSPKLAEPQVDRSLATAHSTKGDSRVPPVAEPLPGYRPNGHAQPTFRANSSEPPTSTAHLPSDQPSHSFKHFVGGIFRRKHGNRDSEERDITPPKGDHHHGLLSSFRHSRSRSPASDAPPTLDQIIHEPAPAVRPEPPPGPEPRPQASSAPPSHRTESAAPPSNTPPDQLPSDPSMPAAPSQVVEHLSTSKTRAGKRVASGGDEVERMTKSPKIEARSPMLRSEAAMASPRLRTKGSVTALSKGQRRRQMNMEESNGGL